MATKFRSPRTVGFRHPVWSSYGPWILGGVVDFMRGHESWRLATENDSYGEMEAVKIDADWQGEGVILFRATEEELARFRARGMAVVLTSTEGPDLGFPRVVPDNARIGAMAAEHLVECAMPHFGFLARGETLYREKEFAPGLRRYARERLGGYRAKLAEYAREPRVHYLKGRPLWKAQTWREVETEAMAFLDTLPKPCGLFVVDDSLGAVVLRAADRLGLEVPGDLAVISFGDDPLYCHASLPALSTIAYPAHEVGMKAGEALWRQMNGENFPAGYRVEIPVDRLVPRESSDTLAVADPEIRELVRYIRLTAPHDPIRVSELAERSGLSQTTIKARFAASLGHGPKHEIQRVRLAHLQALLADRSLSLAEIARRMKFASAHELSRYFLAGTGRRPSDYRAALGDQEGGTSRPRRHAVVFDMDGTLFDTEPMYFEAYRDAFARQGGVLTREEYFGELTGTTNEHIERWLGGRHGDSFDLPAFREAWRKRWRKLAGSRDLAPLPGVKEWLEGLCESGIPVALASSSDREDIDLCLEASGLAGYFRAIAAGDEVPAGKPAPDVYLLACGRLGVEPSHCLAVEDSRHGVDAALAAGLAVLVVDAAATPPPGVRVAGSLAEVGWREYF